MTNALSSFVSGVISFLLNGVPRTLILELTTVASAIALKPEDARENAKLVAQLLVNLSKEDDQGSRYFMIAFEALPPEIQGWLIVGFRQFVRSPEYLSAHIAFALRIQTFLLAEAHQPPN